MVIKTHLPRSQTSAYRPSLRANPIPTGIGPTSALHPLTRRATDAYPLARYVAEMILVQNFSYLGTNTIPANQVDVSIPTHVCHERVRAWKQFRIAICFCSTLALWPVPNTEVKFDSEYIRIETRIAWFHIRDYIGRWPPSFFLPMVLCLKHNLPPRTSPETLLNIFCDGVEIECRIALGKC